MQSDIATEVRELRLVDTHEHLGLSWRPGTSPWSGEWLRTPPQPAEREWVDHGPDILQDLFSMYPRIDLSLAGASAQALDRLLDPAAGDIESRFEGVRAAWEAMEHTGFGQGVKLIMRAVYGAEDLTAESMRHAQVRLEALQRPGEVLRLLRDQARLDHVQIDDSRWACAADQCGPEFFLYDLSWFWFCEGRIDPATILSISGVEVRTLADLREAIAAIFSRFARFAVAVKSQHAYTRTLMWEERTDAEAARALTAALAGEELDEGTRRALGDWCFARGVEQAIEHGLPFKLHTGVVVGSPTDWSRPANLCGLLARYPDARFVLMHIGYPYGDELIGVAKSFGNVWVDLCWAWSLNPYASVDFLRKFLNGVPANKLFAFGGDVLSPTNAVAYSIQARRSITRALEAEIAAGDLTERQASRVAHRIMRENQYQCFDIDGVRRSAVSALAADGTFDSRPRSHSLS